MSMRGIEGSNVVVTGAASGIGRAIALRLGAEGARVGIFDRDAKGGEDTAAHILQAGGTARAWPVDITDLEAVREAVAHFEEVFGPTGGLVNSAGWDRAMPFLETTPELWSRILAVNLIGPLNMHHAVLPGMVARGRGKVVNIASDAARAGSSGEAVYAAAKGGIVAFTKTLARELARSGIRLNAVCPGPTDTPLFRDFAGTGERGEKLRRALERAIPLGRLGRPEDYAGLVCLLLSEDADYITGQTISVSGGLTMQ